MKGISRTDEKIVLSAELCRVTRSMFNFQGTCGDSSVPKSDCNNGMTVKLDRRNLDSVVESIIKENV